MICLDIDTEKLIVKGSPRTNGAYNSHQIRMGKGRYDYLELTLPKTFIPYLPKDTKNSSGETFMREFNLQMDIGDSANGRHGKSFIEKIKEIKDKVGELTNIKMKDPFFVTDTSGTLFSVKIKTEFGTNNFNIDCFDKDAKYVENMDTSKLKGHIISGKIKLDRIWSKRDGSLGGLDWTLVSLRDYGTKDNF